MWVCECVYVRVGQGCPYVTVCDRVIECVSVFVLVFVCFCGCLFFGGVVCVTVCL